MFMSTRDINCDTCEVFTSECHMFGKLVLLWPAWLRYIETSHSSCLRKGRQLLSFLPGPLSLSTNLSSFFCSGVPGASYRWNLPSDMQHVGIVGSILATWPWRSFFRSSHDIVWIREDIFTPDHFILRLPAPWAIRSFAGIISSPTLQNHTEIFDWLMHDFNLTTICKCNNQYHLVFLDSWYIDAWTNPHHVPSFNLRCLVVDVVHGSGRVSIAWRVKS